MIENKFDRLKRMFEDYKNDEKKRLKEGIADEKYDSLFLSSDQDTFAMYHYFIDMDIIKTKQSFYKKGRVKVFLHY